MYRFLDGLTPEDVEAIAALAYVEMLEAGFGERRRVPLPAPPAGRGALRRPGRARAADRRRRRRDRDRADAAAGALQLRRGRGGAAGRRPAAVRVRPRRLPAAARGGAARGWRRTRCSGSRRIRCGRRRRSRSRRWSPALPDGPMHIHAAEQVREVEEVEALARGAAGRLPARPSASMPRWCLIHCTQMTADETRRLAASGAVAGLCPITEANLGDGIFDGRALLAAGGRVRGRVGFATSASRVGRASCGARIQPAAGGTRRATCWPRPANRSGRRSTAGALPGGAQAPARPCGRDRAGALADLVAHRPRACRRWRGSRTGHAPRRLDLRGRRPGGAEVWSAGRPVVRDGRHVARDAVEPRYRARAAGADRPRLIRPPAGPSSHRLALRAPPPPTRPIRPRD